MRMWMVYPIIMCWNHLNGEHAEHHMFCGTIKKGISIQGYLNNNLLEPSSLSSRHEQLAQEMYRRKGKIHNSPFPMSQEEIKKFMTNDQYNNEINKYDSLVRLLDICPKCRERALWFFIMIQNEDNQKNANIKQLSSVLNLTNK